MSKSKEFYEEFDLENLTKEELLDNSELAMGLAEYNMDFGKHPLAQDFEVLSLRDGGVAYHLAENSTKNGWWETEMAQNWDVLSLYDGNVALALARGTQGHDWWETPAAQDLKVLALCNGRVAVELVFNSFRSGWSETPVVKKKEVWDLADGEVGKMLEMKLEKNNNLNLGGNLVV